MIVSARRRNSIEMTRIKDWYRVIWIGVELFRVQLSRVRIAGIYSIQLAIYIQKFRDWNGYCLLHLEQLMFSLGRTWQSEVLGAGPWPLVCLKVLIDFMSFLNYKEIDVWGFFLMFQIPNIFWYSPKVQYILVILFSTVWVYFIQKMSSIVWDHNIILFPFSLSRWKPHVYLHLFSAVWISFKHYGCIIMCITP